MFRAFNMGIGLIIVCDASRHRDVVESLRHGGEHGVVTIGRVVAGHREVRYTA